MQNIINMFNKLIWHYIKIISKKFLGCLSQIILKEMPKHKLT